MLRVSWKSLLARRLRLLLSAFAIVLGVAFVAGSLVFTDTLGRAFTAITSGSVGDVIVQPRGSAGLTGAATSATVPAALVPRLAALPGAARADGNVTSYGTFVVSTDGTVVGGNGAPGIAVNHTGGPAAHGVVPMTLVAGRWPTGPDEVVLDEATASRAGYRVGARVPLVSAGAEPLLSLRLVGTMSFRSGGLLGASVAVLDTAAAQRQFLDGARAYSTVWVTARDGVSQTTLRARVAAVLPSGLEAVTGDAVAKQDATQIQRALGFVTTFLLVFAGVALVVGTFLIVNTFSILVAQRGRELALLRALGASRGQVVGSVLFEALVVGLLGSTAGLGLGVALAVGIRALFAHIGLDLSGTPLVLRGRTVGAAYAVGVLVTLAAAYLPARRAGRVPPVAAMREDVEVGETPLRRRVALGALLVGVGAVALGLGLFADVPDHLWWVGLGILGVVLGVAMTSPLVGRPVLRALGTAYRMLFPAVGRMAEQNALRNPRRTAATASALMIGVTLVSMMAVVGASATASIDTVISEEFAADFVVSNVVGQPFSPAITARVAAVPGVADVAALRYTVTDLGGRTSAYVAGADPRALRAVLPLTMRTGSLADLGADGILVESGRAAAQHLAVGSTLTAGSGGGVRFTVVGTYARNTILGTSYLVSFEGLDRLGAARQDSVAYLTVAPGADRLAVERGLDAAVRGLPLVTVKDQAAYAAEQREPVDQLLHLVDALLGLAIVIAVLGIVNTLGLSVIERTREIGLLRAIGLLRTQLWQLLTLESVAIALLGAVLGIVLGVGFGIALQRALAGQGLSELAIPARQLLGFLVLSGVVGVLAALWPGRRAARLDILRAITAE